MDPNEAHQTCARLTDDQEIQVATKSGRTFRGFVVGAETDPDGMLVFETLEGQKLQAEWKNITEVGFRSGRGVASTMMIPPEHPLAPKTERSDRMKAYTVRNGHGD